MSVVFLLQTAIKALDDWRPTCMFLQHILKRATKAHYRGNVDMPKIKTGSEIAFAATAARRETIPSPESIRIAFTEAQARLVTEALLRATRRGVHLPPAG